MMEFKDKLKVLRRVLKEQGETLVLSTSKKEIYENGMWYTTCVVRDEGVDIVLVNVKGIDIEALYDFMELEMYENITLD